MQCSKAADDYGGLCYFASIGNSVVLSLGDGP
jgi:hypothetical protein